MRVIDVVDFTLHVTSVRVADVRVADVVDALANAVRVVEAVDVAQVLYR